MQVLSIRTCGSVSPNFQTQFIQREFRLLETRPKQEHSRKPDEMYDIIESCSPGPYLELFARERRKGWTQWGDELDTYLHTRPVYKGYNGHAIKAPHGSKPAPGQSEAAGSPGE